MESSSRKKIPEPKKYSLRTNDGTLNFTLSPVQKRLESLTDAAAAGNEARAMAEAQHVASYSAQMRKSVEGFTPTGLKAKIESEFTKKERLLAQLAERGTHKDLIAAAAAAPDTTYDQIAPSKIANIVSELNVLYGLSEGTLTAEAIEEIEAKAQQIVRTIQERTLQSASAVAERTASAARLKDIRTALAHETSEGKERAEIDARIEIAAAYLKRLDTMAECVTVDSVTRRIAIEKERFQDRDITDTEVQKYHRTFAELQNRFRDTSIDYMAQLRQAPGVLDAQLVLGAIVVTYDSSKQRPDFDGQFVDADSRGWHQSAKPEYLGLVGVDISRKDRDDGVEPTVSVVHELQHHTRAMSDYLITQDPEIDMQSAHKAGRSVALFGEGKDRMNTRQAYAHDIPQYSALLGRQFDASELPNVIKQQAYLDELHSSYLQRKPDWFAVDSTLYSTHARGKHRELVGSNTDDLQKTTEMIGYLQGFYSLDLIQKRWANKYPLWGRCSRNFSRSSRMCIERWVL